MNFNQLSEIIKKKILKEEMIKSIEVEDKSYLHIGHKTNEDKKFHLILKINSLELKSQNKITSNRYIFNILKDEIKNYIHSLQILFI